VFVIQPADAYSYAYLLGAYLGDGYVGKIRRSYQLVITLDAV
jgi:DNA-binding transcriptional regulator WhiA